MPVGFIPFDVRDYGRPESVGVKHLCEEWHQWFIEEVNALALNNFIGLGYKRLAVEAVRTSANTLPLTNGEPNTVPATPKHVVH